MVCYVTGILGQNISDDLIERVVSLFDESVVNRRQDTLHLCVFAVFDLKNDGVAPDIVFFSVHGVLLTSVLRSQIDFFCFKRGNYLFHRRVYLFVREGVVGTSQNERVSDALVSVRNLQTGIDVEDFNAFKQGSSRFPDLLLDVSAVNILFANERKVSRNGGIFRNGLIFPDSPAACVKRVNREFKRVYFGVYAVILRNGRMKLTDDTEIPVAAVYFRRSSRVVRRSVVTGSESDF